MYYPETKSKDKTKSMKIKLFMKTSRKCKMFIIDLLNKTKNIHNNLKGKTL